MAATDKWGWRFQRMPLRRRLLVSSLVGTVPLIVLGIALLISQYLSRRAIILENNLATARLASVYVEGWVGGQLSTLRTLAKSEEATTGNVAEKQALTERQLDAHAEWQNLFITDARGQIIAGNLHPFVFVGDRGYFRRAQQTAQPSVSNILVSRATGARIVVVAYPIIHHDVFQGIIAATVPPEEIQQLFSQVATSSNTTVLLWGSDRDVIAGVHTPATTDNYFTNAALDAMLNHGTGTRVTPSPALQQRLLVGYAPVRGTTWTVTTSTPITTALTPVYQNLFIFIAASVLVLVLTVAWAVFAADLFSRQVQTLSEGAHAIGTGNFATRIAVQAGDELDALAHSLNKMAADLAMLGKMRSDLLGMVSHELRTPLTTIRTFLDLLATGTLTTEYPGFDELLTSASRQARRLQDMIDNLLSAARADVGIFTVAARPTLLDQIVRVSVRLYEGIIREHGLELVINVPEEICVHADATRVTLAINNLLDNAVKYTEQGTITLAARIDGDTAVVTIRDTGRGFTPEVGARLYEKFYRAEPLLTRESGGAGLGLPVVKAVVEAHGGRVFAESAGPRQGSTFGFTLPLAQEPCTGRRH